MSFVSPPFSNVVLETLLALNNAHAEELSYKTPEDFHALLNAAHVVWAGPEGHALLVAFCEASTYDNPNFHWLKARFPRFIYIDRVVVAAAARGQGLARRLYEDVEQRARHEGRERLVCEINLNPPNPASDVFHERLGFQPVGSQVLNPAKSVRYWAKELASEQNSSPRLMT